MSRCYPFRPRTGILRNGAGDGALIQPIKENEKHKTEPRKGRKYEKKERRKDNREVKKLLDVPDAKSKSLKRLYDAADCSTKSLEQKYFQKKNVGCGSLWDLKRCENDGSEQMEKSDLTEEHGEPVSSQNHSYMSDETQSSSKKRRISSPSSGGITVQRNILRIRLPSRKPKEAEDSQGVEQQTCSTSGQAADSIVQQKQILHVPGQELCSSDGVGRQIGTLFNLSKKDDAQSVGSENTPLCKTKLQSTRSPYEALFEDFDLPPLQAEPQCGNDSDDQEWLFGTKQQRQETKKLDACNEVPSRNSNVLWPAAHYLAAADIYALPFSVPF